jgi:3-oxoacyl-[acyl-carrier-protein] synthase-3
MFSDGKLGDILKIPQGYAKCPPHFASYQHKMHKVKMVGTEIFKSAVRNMVDCSQALLEENGFKPSDVDFFIFHQANKRIIEMCMKALDVPESKTWINVNKYGNTSAGTLPICLAEAWDAGAIKPGQLILMTTFGGGATWGSTLIRL